MHVFPNVLVGIAVLAVAAVLILGLVNMLRQGPGSGNRSQTFMRWRVGLQFLAIVVIVCVLYFRPH
jgi:xanthine/uracil permease